MTGWRDDRSRFNAGTKCQDLDVGMLLVTPYPVIIEVDPATHTYSATISQTDRAGVIIDSGSLTGLNFDQNVINNQQNGKLQFYIRAEQGGAAATVDNIRIQNGAVPEPTTGVLLTCGLAALLLRRHRKAA